MLLTSDRNSEPTKGKVQKHERRKRKCGREVENGLRLLEWEKNILVFDIIFKESQLQGQKFHVQIFTTMEKNMKFVIQVI